MKALILSAICFATAVGQAAFGQSATQPPPPPAAAAAPAAAMQSATVAPARPRVQRPIKKPVMQPKRSPVEATPAERSQPPAVRRDGQASAAAKPKHHAPPVSFSEAQRRCERQTHNPVWWKTHYTVIVFVIGAYYYYDAGYWFPAWGYDPGYNNYDYDGPIYTYGNLLPDQVIRNVQRALKDLGYYSGDLTGSLSKATRAALTAFQQDNGMEVTGAIDAPTVEALGLVSSDEG